MDNKKVARELVKIARNIIASGITITKGEIHNPKQAGFQVDVYADIKGEMLSSEFDEKLKLVMNALISKFNLVINSYNWYVQKGSWNYFLSKKGLKLFFHVFPINKDAKEVEKIVQSIRKEFRFFK